MRQPMFNNATTRFFQSYLTHWQHIFFCLIFSSFFLVNMAQATGMQPETSVVILDESEGETSINLKNTDAVPSLLVTTIENIPEDSASLVIVTPPVARVEAGETQLVRFISQASQPIKTQRLKRVIFEGIPQRISDGRAKLTMTVQQNLPLIIHPKGLKKEPAPWTLLTWSINDGKVTVNNNSPYIVRLDQTIKLQPSGTLAKLPRTYILPGEIIHAAVSQNALPNTATTSITLYPATVYGYAVDQYDALVQPALISMPTSQSR